MKPTFCCGVCGRPVETFFNYCPFCGKELMYLGKQALSAEKIINESLDSLEKAEQILMSEKLDRLDLALDDLERDLAQILKNGK